MDTLPVSGADAPQMPRFDDGMVNMQELFRAMAESLVNEIMDAQAEDACADGNRRNGYRERRLITSVGAINLRIPKLRRGSYFPEDLLTRYSRVDRRWSPRCPRWWRTGSRRGRWRGWRRLSASTA